MNGKILSIIGVGMTVVGSIVSSIGGMIEQNNAIKDLPKSVIEAIKKSK